MSGYSVEHFGSGEEQTTTVTVETTDATGETSTYEFEGDPGGPYEYAGDGEPTDAALQTLAEHIDAESIDHDVPVDDQDDVEGESEGDE